MKHLESRQGVGGWQVQVSLLALAASHSERELAELLTAEGKATGRAGSAWVKGGWEGGAAGLGVHGEVVEEETPS